MAAGFNEEGLVYSENYAKTMDGQVLPFLHACVKKDTVSGAGEKPLSVSRFDADAPRGTVAVLHGFTECAEKFSELIYSLLHQGYSVVAYDQRGHGYSWRDERIHDLSLTHVDHFQEYVDDLKAVCDRVLKEMPKPWFIFAHSMGGAVALAFLEDDPGVFAKAALCAPMVAPQRSGVPLWAGKAMCIGAKALGQGRKRIPMNRPWSGPEDFGTSAATGRERFDWYDALKTREEKYHNNGPTFSWTLEAFNVTRRLLAAGAPEKIRIPVRIYSAETDQSVISEEHGRIAARMPNAKTGVVAGAKHEIYRSPDSVLFPWWHEILTFLDS